MQRKILKYAIVIAFLLILKGICYGQMTQNIFDGRVITAQNDTLKGELDVVTYFFSKTPTTIGFRKKTDYKFSRYYMPKELKTVVLYIDKGKDSLIYHTKQVTVFLNKETIKRFSMNSTPILKDTAVFLRAIILGNMSLYVFSDALGKPYFFIEKKGKKIEELVDIGKQFIPENARKTLDYSKKLAELFKDCSAFNDFNFNKFHLDLPELIEIVRQYNQLTTHSTPQYVVSQTQNNLYFGVMLGGHFTTVKQNGWVHQNQQLTPSVGIWSSIAPFNKAPLTFYGEVEYAQLNTTAKRTHTITVLHYLDSSVIKLHYLNLNLLMGYEFQTSKFTHLYSKIGTSAGVVIQNGTNHYSYLIDDLFQTKFGNTPLPYRIFELGLLGAAGVRYKNAAIEARFRLSNGYSSAEMVKTSVSNMSLNLFWTLSNNKLYPKAQLKY